MHLRECTNALLFLCECQGKRDPHDADRQKGKAMPETTETESKVTPLLTDSVVKRLVKAGAAFVKAVAGSTLDKLRADIRDTVEAHAVYRPAYDTAAAAWRKREGKAADDSYSAASFVTYLESRLHTLEGDDAVFPLNAGQVKRIVEFEGDLKSHQGNERAFLAYCAEQEVRVQMASYVKWIGLRADGKVNDDGTWTAIGQKAIDDAEAEDAAVEYKRVCGQDFSMMLDGVAQNVRHAWIRAAILDLQHLDALANAAASTADLQAVRKLVKQAQDKGSVISYVKPEAATEPATV